MLFGPKYTNTTGVKLCCDVSLYSLLKECSPVACAARLLGGMIHRRAARAQIYAGLRILPDVFKGQVRIFVGLGKISKMADFLLIFQEENIST